MATKKVTQEQLAAVYGPEYYATHCGPIPYDRSRQQWFGFFGNIAEELIRSFRPVRVFDAGCAHGFLVEALWDRGIQAWGRDISEFAISQVRADIRQYCSVGTISDTIKGRFDLVVCIEVLEHMPEKEAIRAIKQMTSVADRIVFSSSPTDLEESTHINVKPPIYWLRLFAESGFAPVATHDLPYVTPHAFVVERSNRGRSEFDLVACAALIRSRIQVAECAVIIADARRQLADRDQLIAERDGLKTRVAEGDQRIQDLNAQVAADDQNVQSVQAQIAERDRRLSNLNEQLGIRDQNIADLQTHISERDRAVLSLRSQLVFCEKNIYDSESKSVEREQNIRDLQEKVFSSDQIVLRSTEQIRNLESQLVLCEQNLYDLEAKSVENECALNESKQRVLESDRDIGGLQIQLEQLRTEYRQILTSTSWRATAPLRWVGARMPPIIRKRVRQILKLIWWTATMQIIRRFREWRALRQRIAPTSIRLGSTITSIARKRTRQFFKLIWWTATLQLGWRFREWNVLRQRRKSEARTASESVGGVVTKDPSALPVSSGRESQTAGSAIPFTLVSSDQESQTAGSAIPYEPWGGMFLPWFEPLNVEVLPALTDRPCLNIVLPRVAMASMSGGPNTALSIGVRLALLGVAVRVISSGAPPDQDLTKLQEHIRELAETDRAVPNLEVVDGSDRNRPLSIGGNDIFMATAWWTAQMVKYAIRHTKQKRFVYLIQDYEPLLHAASSVQALAEETYSLDFIPVINTGLLHEFLRERSIGRFASEEFSRQALIFEPAVDSTRFFAQPNAMRPRGGRQRLLFYARPTTGLRNLFELGVAALQMLIAEDSINPADWEFLGMGEKFAPIDLGKGAQLVPLPWLDLDSYAEQMRQADVLLSPMFSPHPSYPPLEMAACGGMVVTTTYGNKTAQRLAQLSPNIIGVSAAIEDIASGLLLAMQKSITMRGLGLEGIGLPATWTESLSEVVLGLHEEILKLLGAPILPTTARVATIRPTFSGVFPGYRHWPTEAYEMSRFATLKDRRNTYSKDGPSLFSFITTVWNTAPEFLADLAETVFGQEGETEFEWIILNNGTQQAETRSLLAIIAMHPCVRLYEVPENIGIVRGLRYCLEHAKNRYVVPLDSDDLLTPDCLRVLATTLVNANYPTLAYTDEDKVSENKFIHPYCKPDWDPVLFTHSCYIAHLCAIDRACALELAAYTNLDAEGSHDWDTFLRFWQAGHEPFHIPEIVYTWRMHPQSTSGNINSKNYIHSSQLSILNRFIAGCQNPQSYHVDLSPLFNGAPDWRFIRATRESLPISTLTFGQQTVAAALPQPLFSGHQIERIAPTLSALLAAVEICAAEKRFVHLLSASVEIDDPTWAAEAVTLMELFPETAIVGGRIHDNGIIVAADDYFGFGDGCDSPNIGRSLQDPGFFAQMWKPHSASAVPIHHCVMRPEFLVQALSALIGTGASFSNLGAWLGAAARERGQRVIYSPFLSATTTQKLGQVSPIEKAAFAIAYAGSLPDTRLMSSRLGLTVGTAYLPISRSLRSQQEAAGRALPLLSDVDRRAAERIAGRIKEASGRPARGFSVLTLLYARSPIEFFRETARSILDQTRPFAEWIILENGPVPHDVSSYLDELQADNRVRRLKSKDLGIIGGLRYCFEQSTGEYILPLDGDDTLSADALQRLTNGFEDVSKPSFVFSDEDVLSGSALISPFRRTAFDPILNCTDSYVWHAIAFRRDKAVELGVYTNSGAEYCHDWDTISLFANAGERIFHVPHILYHWRTHASSSSNSGSVNIESLKSVKCVMEETIAKQANPDLYEVRLFPISRGVDQYAILRRPIAPLGLCLLYLHDADTSDAIPSTILAKLSEIIRESRVVEFDCPSDQVALSSVALALTNVESEVTMVLWAAQTPADTSGIWDAMLLFEMHADVAAAAGRITNGAGSILDCCTVMAVNGGGPPNWVGMQRNDPGDYAMALKQQTAATITPDYFFCRTDILREAVSSDFDVAGCTSLAARVQSVAELRGMRLAYSPLIEAARSVTERSCAASSQGCESQV